MDYSTFKPLFGLLLFGSALVFGLLELRAIKRSRKLDRRRPPSRETTD